MSNELELLYEDADYLAVNKPAGIETVTGGDDDLTTRVRQKFGAEISPAHRLDRDTTGAALFARHAAALAQIVEAFKRRRVEKIYRAICAGVPANPAGIIQRNLSEWQGGRRPVRVVKKGGLTAATAYRLAAANAEFPACLLEFCPREGRTHQIRVHAAAFGRPILGDDQYGDRAANQRAKQLTGLRRQALHAWRLTLPGNGATITAPLPVDLQAAMTALFGEQV
ncbi:MAG: RluA family pseudouridine synthase [Planctomycetota bacterium]|jgi:RluA family pseudouridine synthase|nr:RluA family pseudouridine synthase [Planctomycetota bacterium]